MNYYKMFKLFILTMNILFFVGCGGGSSNKVIKEVSSNIDTTTGAISEDIVVEIGDNSDKQTSIKIPEGTEFIDIESNKTINVPNIKATLVKDLNRGSSTISFEYNGKKVIPTQPIVVSLPAPTGAKPGDSVQLEVPDGVTANKMEVSQKLITVIVKADGTVDITVFPDVLRNLLVIVIIIADQSTN